MNRIILYAIEIVLCSGLFLALYRLLIQRKAGYTFCRRYLVVTLILAAAIPAFDVPVYVEREAPAEAVQPAPEEAVQTSQTIRNSQAAQEIVPSAPASDRNVVAPSFRMNWNALVIAVYLAGLLFSLALMLRSYITIARLKRGSRLSREDGYELAQNDDVESPFSFGKTIFMGRVSSDSERRQILSHEMSHIGHHHTQEKLLMSAIRSCLWFNPFAWLQERHLEEVQEWQADADVLAHGFNVDDYRNTILKTLLGVNPAVTSGLNGSFTKKRMQQMGTEENHGHAAMVSLAAIALTAVCFCLFSLNVQARPVISTDHIKAGDIISGVVSDSIGQTLTMAEDSDLLSIIDRVRKLSSMTSDSLDLMMDQMQKSMREPIMDSPKAGSTVNGHVLDIDGNLIRNRDIKVCERDLVGRAVTMGSASGDDGFFSLFSIRSPENHLAIEAEGYESQNLPLDRGTFEVRLKPAPVTLKPGDVVRGSVTCSQKTGPFTALHTAIGAKVEEVDRNGGVVASVLTDENGFSLTIVNPRDRLVISTDGYTPVSTSIEIRNYSFTLHKIQ
ncbi:MAG: M56 family metallopeptidase [Bacteroidaceae bacterium]|nr:M56 family metallopeptidase [Bacteroidaceae bacterium]